MCKQVGLYGIPAGSIRRPRIEGGDHLLVWQGGQGYIAEAMATGPIRMPNNDNEVRWPGGTYRFTYVVPIEVLLEVKSPLKLAFVGNEQAGMGWAKGKFQLSLTSIPDEAATYISIALREKQAAEASKDAGMEEAYTSKHRTQLESGLM